ncbi:MAG TPA: O-antigen ligase family protein [Dehalococcoidia bacterium]|nr:O-antigen ligase family protein [Dehalococcoidia bacterium]
MRDISHPHSSLVNRRALLGIIALIGLVWLGIIQFGIPWPLALVLAAQLALFVLLFKRPVWAMASLMVGQLTSSQYVIYLTPELEISVRFLWTILAVLLLVPILQNRGGVELGNGARRILVPAIIFFALATISNAVNTDMTNTLKYSRSAVTAMAILVLLPAVVENRRDIKLLSLVVLITGSISAIVAVMQHYSYIGMPSFSITTSGYGGTRTEGLTESALHLAFYLPVILIPMVSIYFLKGVGPGARKILAVLTIVMIAALYFTFTRSGMYALAPGLLAIIFWMQDKPRKELLLASLVLIAAFVYYSDMTSNRYSQWFTDDSSAAARPVLWQAGISIAMDNPLLGIGYYSFQEESLEYSSNIRSQYMETQGAGGILGQTEVHNDFIRAWLSYGTLALLAYVSIFVGILRNFLDVYRKSTNRFLKGLALGCCGALVAYVVNAFTHNVMDSVWLLWIMGGFSIAVVKLLVVPKPDEQANRS